MICDLLGIHETHCYMLLMAWIDAVSKSMYTLGAFALAVLNLAGQNLFLYM